MLTVAKGLKELLIQVVAVGDNDQRRVVHRLGQDQFTGIEDHGETLTAALSVPDHAGPLIAFGLAGDGGQAIRFRFLAHHLGRISRRAQGRGNGAVDGIILMVGGDLLDRLVAALFKDDEMANEIKERLLVEQSLDQRHQCTFGFRVDNRAPISSLPLHKAPIVAGKAARLGKPAITDDQQGIGDKEGGDELFVGLQLVKGGFDAGVFIPSIFKFDDD